MNQKNKRHWFRARKNGYGWTPASFEGYLVIFLYIILNIGLFIRINRNSDSGSDTLIGFGPIFVILTLILIFTCLLKGEKTNWNWGRKKTK